MGSGIEYSLLLGFGIWRLGFKVMHLSRASVIVVWMTWVFLSGAQAADVPKAAAPTPGAAGLLVATGRGRQPWRSANKAQARLMAKRAAMVEAYKNMAGMLGMADSRPKDGAGTERVKGFIRGARLREARYYADGDVEVDIEMEPPAGGLREGSSESATRKTRLTDAELLFVEKGGGTISEAEWRELLSRD